MLDALVEQEQHFLMDLFTDAYMQVCKKGDNITLTLDGGEKYTNISIAVVSQYPANSESPSHAALHLLTDTETEMFILKSLSTTKLRKVPIVINGKIEYRLLGIEEVSIQTLESFNKSNDLGLNLSSTITEEEITSEKFYENAKANALSLTCLPTAHISTRPLVFSKAHTIEKFNDGDLLDCPYDDIQLVYYDGYWYDNTLHSTAHTSLSPKLSWKTWIDRHDPELPIDTLVLVELRPQRYDTSRPHKKYQTAYFIKGREGSGAVCNTGPSDDYIVFTPDIVRYAVLENFM